MSIMKNEALTLIECDKTFKINMDQTENQRRKIPVMAAVAVRKKVVSIGHFSPCFCLQSLKFFLFVGSNQKQLNALIALKIREK